MATQNSENGDTHDHELTVDTLRSPPLRIPPAPLPRRLVAIVIDSVIVAAAWQLAGYLFHLSISPTLPVAAVLAGAAFFYYFLFEWVFSATIGKLVMKLRVLGIDGDPCTMQGSALRNLLRLVDWLPAFYVVGGVLLATSEKRQRAGDRVANTIATSAPEKDRNPPPAPFLFH